MGMTSYCAMAKVATERFTSKIFSQRERRRMSPTKPKIGPALCKCNFQYDCSSGRSMQLYGYHDWEDDHAMGDDRRSSLKSCDDVE